MTEFTTWRSLVDGEEIVAIPDSVIYQWSADQFADPWVDDIADANMQIDGLTATTLSDDSAGVSGDGTDAGRADISPDVVGSNRSWEFEFEFTESTQSRPMGIQSSSDDTIFFAEFNRDENANDDEGNINFTCRDSAGDLVRAAPATNPNINDGSLQKISVAFGDLSNNEFSIFINGSEVDTNTAVDEGPSGFTTDMEFGFFAERVNGAFDNNTNMDVKKFRFHNEEINEQTI